MDIIMELEGLLEVYTTVILIIVGSIILLKFIGDCIDGSSYEEDDEKEA